MIMNDWVTARVPCNHGKEIAGGAVVSYKDAANIITLDGDPGPQNWSFAMPLPIVGSHDTNVRINTSACRVDSMLGREIRIDGNLVKFFQGHNLFGSPDIVGLVSAFMEHLCGLPQLGLCPTDLQRQMWYNGAFELSRVDLTRMYQLNNLPDVLSWLATAEHTATMNHRGRDTQNGDFRHRAALGLIPRALCFLLLCRVRRRVGPPCLVTGLRLTSPVISRGTRCRGSVAIPGAATPEQTSPSPLYHEKNTRSTKEPLA